MPVATERGICQEAIRREWSHDDAAAYVETTKTLACKF